MRIGHEQDVAQRGDDYAFEGIAGQVALAQRLAALQTRQDEAYGQNHEERARAAGDAELVAAVDGEVVAQHAVAEAEEY